MKITLHGINQAVPALQELGDLLTIKEAYWLSKDIKKLQSEIKTLLDQEIDIDVKPIKLEKLEQLKLEGVRITTIMLTNLGRLIEEPKVEKPEASVEKK